MVLLYNLWNMNEYEEDTLQETGNIKIVLENIWDDLVFVGRILMAVTALGIIALYHFW